MDTEQLKRDLEYLLSFAPAQCPSEVEPDLSPMFYVTASYDGDIAIAQRIKDIRDRYGVTIDHDDEDMEFSQR